MSGRSPLSPPERTRRTVVGLGLAAAILGTWGLVHVVAVYAAPWTLAAWPLALVVIALQTWLSVGLFIVAHDAMHGSLAPGRPRLNAAVGRLSLGLYAGFPFGRLRRAHHAHHAAPGTADDPDFHAGAPTRFLPWFARFFATYFGWTQMIVLTIYLLVATLVLDASLVRLLVFWAAPALLSALQLFTFGTWLPHRATDAPFADAHRARSSGFGSWLSLITCFHFGRHHEHHLRPDLPWWTLDRFARDGRRPEGGAAPGR